MTTSPKIPFCAAGIMGSSPAGQPGNSQLVIVHAAEVPLTNVISPSVWLIVPFEHTVVGTDGPPTFLLRDLLARRGFPPPRAFFIFFFAFFISCSVSYRIFCAKCAAPCVALLR